MSKERTIVYTDGTQGLSGDFPIAVIYTAKNKMHGMDFDDLIVDPVMSNDVTRNLYGRIMTLVEATTDPVRLKAVKDVFSKELRAWESDVFDSAREIAKGGNSSTNLYGQHRLS